MLRKRILAGPTAVLLALGLGGAALASPAVAAKPDRIYHDSEDGTKTSPHPAEFRERALRMFAEARPDHASDFAAATYVASRLGVNPETLRLWKKRADVDASSEAGTRSEAYVTIKRLKNQIVELEEANQILRSARMLLSTELGRPSSR